MSYQQKYLKYKAKYLELKNQIGGETIEQIKSVAKERLSALAKAHLSNIKTTKDTDRYLINFAPFIIATKLRLDELAQSNTDLTDLQTTFNNTFDINNGIGVVTLKKPQTLATKTVAAPERATVVAPERASVAAPERASVAAPVAAPVAAVSVISSENNDIISKISQSDRELYVVENTSGLTNLFILVNPLEGINVLLINRLIKLLNFYKISNNFCNNNEFLIHGNIKLKNIYDMNDQTFKISNFDKAILSKGFFKKVINRDEKDLKYNTLAFYGSGYHIYSPLYDIFCIIISIFDVLTCNDSNKSINLCISRDNTNTFGDKLNGMQLKDTYESYINNLGNDNIKEKFNRLKIFAYHIYNYNLYVSQLPAGEDIEKKEFNDFHELVCKTKTERPICQYAKNVKYPTEGLKGCKQMKYLEDIVKSYLPQQLFPELY